MAQASLWPPAPTIVHVYEVKHIAMGSCLAMRGQAGQPGWVTVSVFLPAGNPKSARAGNASQPSDVYLLWGVVQPENQAPATEQPTYRNAVDNFPSPGTSTRCVCFSAGVGGMLPLEGKWTWPELRAAAVNPPWPAVTRIHMLLHWCEVTSIFVGIVSSFS